MSSCDYGKRSICLTGPAEGGKGAATSQSMALEQQKWRTDSEHSGTVRVLEWGGVTRTTAQWPKKWAALYRGSLYVLDSQDTAGAPAVHNLWSSTRSAHPPWMCLQLSILTQAYHHLAAGWLARLAAEKG